VSRCPNKGGKTRQSGYYRLIQTYLFGCIKHRILFVRMEYRYFLSIYLILAWFEVTLSFSLSSPGILSSFSKSSQSPNTRYNIRNVGSKLPSLDNRKDILAATPTLPRLEQTRIPMATDDSSNENEVTERDEEKKDTSKLPKSNAIVIFPLVCKFMVVLLIKFLTDLVVYPSLLLYRLARRTKRRIIDLFGSRVSSIKPNGTAK